jgi:hypothetical protein
MKSETYEKQNVGDFPKWDNDHLLSWGNVIIIIAFLYIAGKIAAVFVGMYLVYKRTRSLWKPFVMYPSFRWFFYDTLIGFAAWFSLDTLVKKFWKPTQNHSRAA